MHYFVHINCTLYICTLPQRTAFFHGQGRAPSRSWSPTTPKVFRNSPSGGWSGIVMLQLIPHEEHFIKEASENDIFWEQLQCGNEVHTPWQQVILRHGRHVFSVTGDVCHKIKALMSIIIFFILIFYFFIYIYILFVSLLSGCCAISGFERHLRLADHSPRFHVRTLNPAG